MNEQYEKPSAIDHNQQRREHIEKQLHILNAKTIEALVDEVIPELGEIRDSNGEILDCVSLTKTIRLVQKGELPFHAITETWGLRDKVRDLIYRSSLSDKGTPRHF